MPERDFEREARQLAAVGEVIAEYLPWIAPEWQVVPRVGRTDSGPNTVNVGEMEFSFSHKVAVLTQHPLLPENEWRRNALHELLHLATIDLQRAVVAPLEGLLRPRLFKNLEEAWDQFEEELVERLVRTVERRHHPNPITTVHGDEHGVVPLPDDDDHYTYGPEPGSIVTLAPGEDPPFARTTGLAA